MNSERVLNVVGMAVRLSCLPSALLSDEMDEYTAYCFNEACAYIISKLQSGEEPVFRVKYKSFADLYSQYN